MLVKTATSLAFATACLTAIASMPAHAQTAGPTGAAPGYSGPQSSQGGTNYAPQNVPPQGMSSPGNTSQGNMSSNPAGTSGTDVVTNGPQGAPPPNRSARQNVRQSERYDRLLETNRGFRQARMRKECGPITDQELRQQCLASFSQDEPYMGSSSSRRHYRSESGR
ncbi:MAG TPA: hypothetical protein VHT52_04765 [Stellaceae bacterium]|nr:hypothetical protein [Stellaceae bacterium]